MLIEALRPPHLLLNLFTRGLLHVCPHQPTLGSHARGQIRGTKPLGKACTICRALMSLLQWALPSGRSPAKYSYASSLRIFPFGTRNITSWFMAPSVLPLGA